VTTYIPFSPPTGQGFSFSATLDGTSYQMLVRWNVFGQRWYLTCLTTNGGLVFCQPLISSPQDGDINLLAGYFLTSTMVFRELGKTFEISP
jgi:hypothetical protein